MDPAEPAPSAFDELLDLRFRGRRVDPDEFLAAHPEISPAERDQIRRFCRSRAPDEPSFKAEPAPPLEPTDFAQPPIARLGSYRLGRRLGAGGMGAVFLAEDETLGRPVAVKILGPDLLGTGERSERFLREARAVARLRHPNIVGVHAAGEQSGFRYMAMEFVPGSNLHDLIAEAAARGTRLAAVDVLRWGIEISGALHAAHQASIIHRDVKPSNIRITEDGRAVLLDFGLVLEDGAASLTESGSFRGSPQYASPEQVGVDGVPIDARTDVYSLGATLYEALTGVAPFRGATREQLFHHILSRDPVPPRRLDPSVSRDLETVILAALEKDPGRRHATAAAFAADLEAVLDGRSISVRPLSPPGRVLRWARRKPKMAALAVIAITALLTAAGLAGFLFSNLEGIRRAAVADRAARLASLLEQAFLEYGEGDHTQAQQLFERALAVAPDSQEARAGFALCRIAEGDAASAIAFLEAPESRNDTGSWSERIRARAHVVQARASGTKIDGRPFAPPSSALDHFVAAMPLLRGACWGHDGDAEAAYEHLRLAVQGSPNATPLFFHELGHAAWHAKRDEAAREIAADIGRLWPESPERWFAIGRTLHDADRVASIDAFEKASNPPPRSRVAREVIAIVLAESGRPQALQTALLLARGEVRSAPLHPKAHVALGVALARSDDLKGAEREFREAIRLGPNWGEPYRRLTQLLVEQNDFSGAETPAREAVRLRPNDARAWNLFGIVMKEKEQFDEAIDAFEKSLAIEPDMAHPLCNLGRALVHRGQIAKGVEFLRKGHEQGSKDPKWTYPSKSWLENAERLAVLERRFDAFRRGEGAKPAVDDRIRFAYEICSRKRLCAEAVKIYEQAFREHPSVAAQQSSRFLRRAVADALTAGTGGGADAPADGAARRHLRDLAFSWFQAAIAECEQKHSERPGTEALSKELELWRKEPLIGRTRPPATLEGLTKEELDEWGPLWARLDALQTPSDSRVSR